MISYCWIDAVKWKKRGHERDRDKLTDKENFRYGKKGQPKFRILTYPMMVTLYSILVIVTVVLTHLIGSITALNRTFPLATLS